MDRAERRAVGVGGISLVVVAGLAMVWPSVAAASVEHVPSWGRAWVDAAMCFAPLVWAPLPAVLGAAAASR